MLDNQTLARVTEAAARLLPRHRVLAAYAFGSRVSGRPRPDSDLDLGYYLDRREEGETLSIAEEMQLAERLSVSVGLDVDLRNLGDASLELRGRVLEEGVRVFDADPSRRVALERDLLARYHDYKPELERMHARRLRTIAERGL